MPTISITLSAEQAQRVLIAFQRVAPPGETVDAAWVRQWLIDQLKWQVFQQEENIARDTARDTRLPLDPT